MGQEIAEAFACNEVLIDIFPIDSKSQTSEFFMEKICCASVFFKIRY